MSIWCLVPGILCVTDGWIDGWKSDIWQLVPNLKIISRKIFRANDITQ